MRFRTPFAVFLAAPFLLPITASSAFAVGATNEPFCEASSKTGLSVCQYRTMAECEQAIQGRDVSCVPNPNPPTRPNPTAGAQQPDEQTPVQRTEQSRARPAMREGRVMRGMVRGGMMKQGLRGGALLPLRIIFALMDSDGDGTISLQEFQAAHEKIFKAMDRDKDGTVSFEEMLNFMHGDWRHTLPREDNDESDNEH